MVPCAVAFDREDRDAPVRRAGSAVFSVSVLYDIEGNGSSDLVVCVCVMDGHKTASCC